MSFCRDFEMIGAMLSERHVRTIFKYVQHDEEQIDDDEDSDAEAGGKCLREA